MSRWVAAVSWLRWLACGAVLLAMRAPSGVAPRAIVSASGTHVWWVAPAENGRWAVLHVERVGSTETPAFHVAATFDDEPAALAAEADRVWVVFKGAAGRSEVLVGQSARNPASGLLFMRPAGLRLCASLPVRGVESVAAHDGTLWALEPASTHAWRLRGERWETVPLPEACAGAAHRELAPAGGTLWLVTTSDDRASSRRWRRSGEAWEEAALDVPAWSCIVQGSPRLAFQSTDGTVGSVQQGVFVREAPAPVAGVPIGWGDGFAAIEPSAEAPRLAVNALAAGADAFGPFVALAPQRSNAARWFHLPILGVLSLGAVMAAVLVRGAAIVRGMPTTVGPEPMPLPRRLLALVIDAAPAAGAALVAFDAELDQLVVPPLWSTDLTEALPFVATVIGTVTFGTLEEAVGGRSLGKRLLGGAVRREDGAVAEPWRHALRNLLKGLVMLSPVLALPVFVGRRRQGLPEAITGTVVARG